MSARSVLLCTLIALLSAAPPAWAVAPPDRIHYQGVLFPGTVLGKALEPLDTGTGRIPVLVVLR